MNKKTAIKDAIAHLNGYVAILEMAQKIPALAVKETIKELKKINHTFNIKGVDGKINRAVNQKRG